MSAIVLVVIILSAIVAICAIFVYKHIADSISTHLLGIIEQLWSIIDDIDTYSDFAKVDDIAYRQLVENRQKDRWHTGITTDGYGLIIPKLGMRIPSTTEDTALSEAHEDAFYEECKVDNASIVLNERYLPMAQTPELLALASMVKVAADSVFYDTEQKTIVHRTDTGNYVQVNFDFTLSTAEDKIADAEELIESGAKVEFIPDGLTQVTQRRFFGLALEGHYILCDASEATHFCKLTNTSYAYAKQSL